MEAAKLNAGNDKVETQKQLQTMNEKYAAFDRSASESMKANAKSISDRARRDMQDALSKANDAADRRISDMEARHRNELRNMQDKMDQFLDDRESSPIRRNAAPMPSMEARLSPQTA